MLHPLWSSCAQMNEEAQRLANHAFGAPLLHVMGYMYDRKAEPWLGNIVGEWFARKYHNAATLVGAVKRCTPYLQPGRDVKLTAEITGCMRLNINQAW